jgi:hypothetical protein
MNEPESYYQVTLKIDKRKLAIAVGIVALLSFLVLTALPIYSPNLPIHLVFYGATMPNVTYPEFANIFPASPAAPMHPTGNNYETVYLINNSAGNAVGSTSYWRFGSGWTSIGINNFEYLSVDIPHVNLYGLFGSNAIWIFLQWNNQTGLWELMPYPIELQ